MRDCARAHVACPCAPPHSLSVRLVVPHLRPRPPQKGMKGIIGSPAYGGITPFRKGTAPGILASLKNAMIPICAKRPLFSS